MNPIRYRRDLYQLFKEPGAAVEIGVAEGNFSRDMLEWKMKVETTNEENKVFRTFIPVPAVTTLYSVDRWAQVSTQQGDAAQSQKWHDANYKSAIEKLCPFGDRSRILRGDSLQMSKLVPDGSLTLLYLDGDRSFIGILKDLIVWFCKVKSGGIIAFHDYENESYGVKRAVRHFAGKRYQIYLLSEDKPEDAGAYIYVD